jgi:hypothetical protein
MTTYVCTDPNCNFQSTDASEYCLNCGAPLVSKSALVPDVPCENAEIEPEQQVQKKKAENKAGVMNRLIRQVKEGIGQTKPENTNKNTDYVGDTNTQVDNNIDDIHDVLPPEERLSGWLIQGDPHSLNGYYQWRVKKTLNGGDIYGIFRRFKNGTLTNKAAYEAVLAATATKAVISRLFSYGTVHAGGRTREDYEITSLCNGESLKSWLKKSEPSVDKARFLAPILINLLNGLHELRLRPLTLTPDMLTISTNEDCLTLNMLGALALTSEGGTNFCSGISSNALLTLPYAAPELFARQVIDTNTETFAIGQILASAVWGEAQDYAYIRNASVPFASVRDKHIGAMIMGTLFPEPEERWSIEDLNIAINTGITDLPKCPPWKSLCPGAASVACTLGGVGYFLAEDLANAIATNWNEAILHLEKILDWLEGTRFKGQVALFRQQQLNGRSPDWILVQLRRLIAPDSPIGWRDLSFDDADSEHSLISLAQKVLNDDEDAKQAMEQLLAADLRGAFTTTPNN